MTKINAIHLPKPQNAVEFELAVLAMAKIVLPCSNLARVGRPGQAQHGIDHEGYIENDPSKPVVLQSKCRNPEKKEKPSDVLDHVKACVDDGFEFIQFIYVTSADRDTQMQKAAREATKWLLEDKKIKAIVRVWDWGYISDEASASTDIRIIFDPTFVPADHKIIQKVKNVVVDAKEEVLSKFEKTTYFLSFYANIIDNSGPYMGDEGHGSKRVEIVGQIHGGTTLTNVKSKLFDVSSVPNYKPVLHGPFRNQESVLISERKFDLIHTSDDWKMFGCPIIEFYEPPPILELHISSTEDRFLYLFYFYKIYSPTSVEYHWIYDPYAFVWLENEGRYKMIFDRTGISQLNPDNPPELPHRIKHREN